MGVVVLPLLLISFTLGYVFKDSGVPIPEIGYVDIWGLLVNNKPQAATELVIENYVIWILFYTIAHFLMYVKPQRSLFHPFKLNPNYPPVSLVLKEIFRSIRGVAICTFYAIMVNQLHVSGELPTRYIPSIFDHDGQVSIIIHVLGIILLYLWVTFISIGPIVFCILNGFTRMFTKFTMNPIILIHFQDYPCIGLNQLFISQQLLLLH